MRSGKVSYEYRNFFLNGVDVAATLVARCGGPSRFFPVADKLYATQDQWKGRVRDLTDAQKQALNALPEDQRLGRLAELAGIPQLAAQHGIAAAQVEGAAWPTRRRSTAREDEPRRPQAQGVEGTPTFFLNGGNIGPHTWATLEPMLREAAG